MNIQPNRLKHDLKNVSKSRDKYKTLFNMACEYLSSELGGKKSGFVKHFKKELKATKEKS